MRSITVAFCLSLLGFVLLPGAASAGPQRPFGSPDAKFNQLSKSSLDDIATTVVLQKSGKIVVSGIFAGPIQRFDATGRPDQTFNANAIAGSVPNARAIVSQADGSIILSGKFPRPLLRLKADGTRDSTFSPRGVTPRVSALALQGNGGLLIGHSKGRKSKTPYWLQRLTPAGAIDAPFANRAAPALDGPVSRIIAGPDGSILVAGSFTGKLKRFGADGTPDATFTANLGSAFDYSVSDIALQPDGKIVVVGNFTGLLRRVDADGTLDAAFNAAAGMTLDDDGLDRAAYTTVVQSNGTILVGGALSYGRTIAEFNADGTPNTAVASTLLGSLNQPIFALVVQPDAKIIAAGGYAGYIKRYYGVRTASTQ
jgi:uncharacterized delta-60 repeat protein